VTAAKPDQAALDVLIPVGAFVMLRPTICAAVVIGIGAAIAAEQAPVTDKREPTFRTSTNLVLLDVSVADRKGRPVRNLEKGAFEFIARRRAGGRFFTYEQRPVSWDLSWITAEVRAA